MNWFKKKILNHWKLKKMKLRTKRKKKNFYAENKCKCSIRCRYYSCVSVFFFIFCWIFYFCEYFSCNIRYDDNVAGWKRDEYTGDGVEINCCVKLTVIRWLFVGAFSARWMINVDKKNKIFFFYMYKMPELFTVFIWKITQKKNV